MCLCNIHGLFGYFISQFVWTAYHLRYFRLLQSTYIWSMCALLVHSLSIALRDSRTDLNLKACSRFAATPINQSLEIIFLSRM